MCLVSVVALSRTERGVYAASALLNPVTSRFCLTARKGRTVKRPQAPRPCRNAGSGGKHIRARLVAPGAGALPITQGSELSSTRVRKNSAGLPGSLGSDRTWDQALALVETDVQVTRSSERSTTYESPELSGNCN